MPFSAFALIAILTLVVVIFAVNLRRAAGGVSEDFSSRGDDEEDRGDDLSVPAVELTPPGGVVTPRDPRWLLLNLGEIYNGAIEAPSGSDEERSRIG
jgi:hypothetical protein